MRTLVELYDNDSLCNAFAQDALGCEKLIFIGGKDMEEKRERLRTYFAARSNPELEFITADNRDTESIYKILKRIAADGDCLINLTGGSDEAVFAAGRLSAVSKAGFIKADIENMRVFGLYNAGNLNVRHKGYSIRDMVELTGGALRRSGRYKIDKMYDGIYPYIDKMMETVLDFHHIWHKQVRYFQNTVLQNMTGKITAPEKIADVCCDRDIMRRLSENGILKNAEFSGGRVSFEFTDDNVRRLITDVGVWLELYVYKAVRESKAFDDAAISVVIDWDGKAEEYDVINEIDVMASKGARLLFISCKTGTVSADAVNEIDILRRHLGGSFARAVIVTATKMSEENLCVYKRARDLGIAIAEYDDLRAGDLGEILQMV